MTPKKDFTIPFLLFCMRRRSEKDRKGRVGVLDVVQFVFEKFTKTLLDRLKPSL